MINATFYPTPRDLVYKMLRPINNLTSRFILEPSAGKGDILDAVCDVYRVSKTAAYAVEIEPDLRKILSGKGYQVIDTDFLQYSGQYHIDLILMNPPFDHGVDHLLKAWEILPYGDIVCILPSETFDNAFSEKRKLLKRLVDEHGSTEDIGQAFKHAERKTPVNCVIVRLHKDEPASSIGFDAADFDFEAKVAEEEATPSPLANNDKIAALVALYNEAAKLTVEAHRIQAKLEYYTKQLEKHHKDEFTPTSLNEKLRKLKAAFWKDVFDRTKVANYVTSEVRKKFDQFTAETSQLAFTVNNIMAVLGMIILNREAIMLECIQGVFERATSYHKKNTIHVEGWKHNKSYRINKKVIIPNAKSSYSQFEYFADDLDKALCSLTGDKFETIRDANQHIRGVYNKLYWSNDYGQLYDCHFVSIRIYKKGTVHLVFKDLQLLARLNQVAAQGKMQVGGGY